MRTPTTQYATGHLQPALQILLYIIESVENLEVHLTTCEMYLCDLCEIRMNNLSNMKTHTEKEHKEKWLIHLKMNRNNINEVDNNLYRNNQI